MHLSRWLLQVNRFLPLSTMSEEKIGFWGEAKLGLYASAIVHYKDCSRELTMPYSRIPDNHSGL